jgi:hypothetical protein
LQIFQLLVVIVELVGKFGNKWNTEKRGEEK